MLCRVNTTINEVLIMQSVYELTHKRFIEIDDETGDKIYDTKLLGFFSSLKKCQEMIPLYLEQPGFREFPEDFHINEIVADVNDYNNVPGEFEGFVYFLSHEWYDGEFDYVSVLGYYSTHQKAEEAKQKYRYDPELMQHPEGFCVDNYKINKREWTEGFFSWREDE